MTKANLSFYFVKQLNSGDWSKTIDYWQLSKQKKRSITGIFMEKQLNLCNFQEKLQTIENFQNKNISISGIFKEKLKRFNHYGNS